MDVWSLALIGNASGKEFPGRRKPTPEAFSIRRLGGSRWRLRQTRWVMGFEWQFGTQSRAGRAPAKSKGIDGGGLLNLPALFVLTTFHIF